MHFAMQRGFPVGASPPGEAQLTPPHKSGLFPIPEDAQVFCSNVVLCIVKWPCFVFGLGPAPVFILRPILCEARSPPPPPDETAQHIFLFAVLHSSQPSNTHFYTSNTRDMVDLMQHHHTASATFWHPVHALSLLNLFEYYFI
jgi:hypothetical protein